MDVADSAGLVDAVASRVLQRLGDPPALQTLGTASQLGPVAGSTGAGQLHARLRVAGVELTQSVQHEDAAGGGYGHENEVPLVALKTLVARAYPVVQPGLFDDRLTGTVQRQRSCT